jgi:glucosamine-6-phosphate deaminase
MNLLRFDSEAAWARAVCSLWRDRLRLGPDMKICLPSGATPTAIYAEMGRSVAAGVVSFARATVFALDEFGGLAADDPGKTAATLRRQLIDQVDLPPPAFHLLDPDHADLAHHCADYDTAIGDGFDLVLLGIGRNGHLGMNEPGAPLDGATRRVDLHPDTVRSSATYFAHGNLPRWGLTVGLKTMLASKEVWVIANGTAKAEIVRRTVRDEITPSNPASLLRRHSHCSLFIDAAAASLLEA